MQPKSAIVLHDTSYATLPAAEYSHKQLAEVIQNWTTAGYWQSQNGLLQGKQASRPACKVRRGALGRGLLASGLLKPKAGSLSPLGSGSYGALKLFQICNLTKMSASAGRHLRDCFDCE